ncbi:MAG: YtxH domain-containing protein [Anaerolineales bacterium]|nr:YtxH domain-containing protein [Anaerolineales bacterium]MCA9976480.1 YtxH domain-containing protein [Anaerolineales bacterium]MCB8989014.1 YtxH domain-containing protein [Ardenticatenaceae bacterium]
MDYHLQATDYRLHQRRQLTMNKVFSFLAGMMSGALVGAVATLLWTPASGTDLQADVLARIEAAKAEFKQAFEETYTAKEAEFEQLKEGGKK